MIISHTHRQPFQQRLVFLYIPEMMCYNENSPALYMRPGKSSNKEKHFMKNCNTMEIVR